MPSSGFQLRSGADWGLGVDVDDSVLASFEPRSLKLLRADEAAGGFFMALEAVGDGRLELGLWKYDAVHIPDDSPVSVYDHDHNESMAAPEAEVPVTLKVEIRAHRGNLNVSSEDVSPG